MEPIRHRSGLHIAAFLLGCLAYCAGAYFFIGWYLETASSTTVTFTFLIAVPAALACFISYISDPGGEKDLVHHLRLGMVPALGALVGGVLLQEGLICILMLLPFWTISALLVTILAHYVRRSNRSSNRLRASAVLLLPLLSAQVEASLPVPESRELVRRTIIIDAPADRVWPLLVEIRDLDEREGRWNVTQDLLGVPRPTEAVIVHRGRQKVRLARWGSNVRFEEQIVETVENETLRWDFAFPDDSIREHTDRHIAPDGGSLTIGHGAYRLRPLGDGRAEVSLETSYVLHTPVNFYASWWGEWMLGDIQSNILQIIKDRAEGGSSAGSP